MFSITHGKQKRSKINNLIRNLRPSGAWKRLTLIDEKDAILEKTEPMDGPCLTFQGDIDWKHDVYIFISKEKSEQRQLLRIFMRLLIGLGVSKDEILGDLQWVLGNPIPRGD